jgi:hypothetical protein
MPSKTNTGANSVTCSGSLTKFKYFGVNEAGAEFSGYSVRAIFFLSASPVSNS